MEILLDILLGVYCLQIIGVLIGNRMNRMNTATGGKACPLSIVVAAQNEEQNIRPCLASLFRQDYGNYEIILVDDRSTDQTGAIALEMKSVCSRLTLLRLDQNRSGLTGKQNALHQGILRSKGEIILVMDADCVALPSWASRMAQAIASGKDLVFGITRIRPIRSFWNKFEALELNFLFTIAVGLARWGFPGSCMGNNLAFRKESYLLVGGFPAMGRQLTEDFVLLQRFSQAGMRWTAESDTPTVTTKPSETFAQWYHQQMRWLAGSLSFKNRLTRALIPLILVNIGALLWLLLANPSPLWITLFCIKLLFDLVLISWRASPGLIPVVPVALLFYHLATPVFLILLVTVQHIFWKGERVKING